MILFTFLYHALSMSASQIDKTIYLVEGEQYKVNLDGIFYEVNENTYSFVSQSKGFTLDTSSLKLKSDQGKYSQQPTKIIRQRQLVNLGDYQGTGQFGILDEYDSGHRICYNSDVTINLDQCIELDNTATNYDFVFIAKDTIAVSKVRVADKQFGVTIYQNKEIISELYFVPSKTYAQVTQTILEYCIFQNKKYLLLGVTEEDSNIEFLEISLTNQIINTNKVIDRSLLPTDIPLQVYEIKGRLDKVYVVCKSSNAVKQIVSLIFDQSWTSQSDYLISFNLRGFELGYSFVLQAVAETYLACEQDYYNVITKQGSQVFNNLFKKVKQDAKVRYTLNYLIILQDNLIIVSTFSKLAQRSNTIEGTILQIDVDFQNDILIVFTDTKILTYYLKQATLQYTSNTVTQNLDLVTIKAVAGENEQIANINFQVLSKDDYNLYLLKDLTQDLYSNRVFYSPINNIPLYGISGADIKVDGKVDDQVEIIPNYLNEYGVSTYEPKDKIIILEQLLTYSSNPYLFRQFEDFSFSVYDCRLNGDVYQCTYPILTDSDQKQKLIVQSHQVGYSTPLYALMTYDGMQISLYSGSSLKSIIQALPTNQFVDMKAGTDRLFVYTKNYYIVLYYFPSGDLINQIDLSQYGQPQGEEIKQLWVNEFKTNLIIMTYGEDLIIGRFTSKFIFIQRLTIKWVLDVIILSDNKFIVLSTDKTNKKLTLYQLSDGEFKVQRDLDTHGYLVTGDNLLSGIVYGDIIVQAQKGQQKVLLAFQDTELARNALLKIIKLQDDEYAVNVIYNSQVSSLLKRSTSIQKNSTILNLNYAYQVVETKLTKIPNKLSQSLDLQYSFGSSLSQNKVELKKNLFLEYQFYNLTAKQDPDNKISYFKREDQIKQTIKPDTFQGQVRTIQLSTSDNHLKLTTRFKNNKVLSGIPESSKCKSVVSFQRLICIKGTDVTYHDITGKLLSQVSVKVLTTSDLKSIIVHNTEQYALVQSSEQLLLIYISENEIKQSNAFQKWENPLDINIFYREWLVVYYYTYVGYFQFQPTDTTWALNKIKEEFIYGVLNIQYDPLTEQIFYTTGYQSLYYFKCSLEGNTLDKQTEYQLNLGSYLQTQKIYQEQTRVQNVQIITQDKKTYFFVSTYYGNILNMTIKSTTQDFQINNMYIINGPSSTVKDIQIIDDYVVVQNQGVQFLFKNTHDWQLDKPYLTLEEIPASNFMALFKNGSQIVHICSDNLGKNLYSSNIDDEMFITINDLKSYTPGNVVLSAFNGYGQAQVDYQTIQLKENESSKAWIWIVVSLLAILVIAGGGFYWYKKKRQSVDPLLAY